MTQIKFSVSRRSFLRVIAFCIIFLISYYYATRVLYNKSCAENFRPFYDMEENFDVLLLGTSVMTSGVSPLDLWHEYGIVSFNLANSGQSLPGNYYALKSALETQQPELVVVDITYIFKDDIVSWSGEARLHELIDNMPLGKVKVEAIVDLVPPEMWGDFFLPMTYYHDRWKELKEEDFKKITSINRGGEIGWISRGKDGTIFDTSVFEEELPILPKEECANYSELSGTYIQKMIDLCRSRGIEMLFVAFPGYAYGDTNHGDGETLQRMWNQFYVTAEENDVDYINCLHHIDEIGFDFVEDLRDWRHINVSGNLKMSHYLGQYMKDKYGIADRRGEESLKYWDDDYAKFDEYRKSLSVDR